MSVSSRLIVSLSAISTGADPRRVDPKAYLEHVKFLASDDLEGRGNGGPGLEAAADYIAAKFQGSRSRARRRQRHVLSAFRDDDRSVSRDRQRLHAAGGGRSSVTFEIGRDYELVSTSRDQSSPAATLPVVFAGYGISAPSLRYDDYAGIDAADKAVLIFTHEPQENDARSAFEGQTNTMHSTMMRKVEVARNHGAKAMLDRGRSQSPAGSRSVPPLAARTAGRGIRACRFSMCRAISCSARSERG